MRKGGRMEGQYPGDGPGGRTWGLGFGATVGAGPKGVPPVPVPNLFFLYFTLPLFLLPAPSHQPIP